MSDMKLPLRPGLVSDWAAAAAAVTIDLSPPFSPRFGEQPWGLAKGHLWRAAKKRNPNAAKQAAAKRARKANRRNGR